MPAKNKTPAVPKPEKESKGNILVFCAHSDDQIIGAGGTLAKYARNGYNIYTFIFSYGETSHPHVKKIHIAKIRVNEAKEADKIIGGDGVFFFGLKDLDVAKDYEKKQKQLNPKIEDILLQYKPKKIFTHSMEDVHPDHQAVKKIILELYDKLNKEGKLKSDIYTFNTYNPWQYKGKNHPVLIVDITEQFKYKLKALNTFKSQFGFFKYQLTNNLVYLSVYFKAIFHGLRNGYKLAEVFYKER